MSDFSDKKILIVEDERPIRDVLVDALRGIGVQVAEAKDGQEGLVKAEEMKPDLILLDVLMPRMDGRAMLSELQKKDAIANTPVIFLTNLSEIQTISEVISEQVPEYIIKSDWSIEEVIEKIKSQLKTA